MPIRPKHATTQTEPTKTQKTKSTGTNTKKPICSKQKQNLHFAETKKQKICLPTKSDEVRRSEHFGANFHQKNKVPRRKNIYENTPF